MRFTINGADERLLRLSAARRRKYLLKKRSGK